MTPRRSSRAHTTQPTPSAPLHNNSSTSSVSSGRTDRNARSHQKLPSTRSSAAPQSQSSEEVDKTSKPPPRRTRSSQDNVEDETLNVAIDDDEDDEGEEVTRCICGHAEYPGMPVEASDPAKAGLKSSGEAPTTVTVREDAGGLFIQCDVCKVWQHGGCVGIMDEAMSPEEYFCEKCRIDLHRITSTING